MLLVRDVPGMSAVKAFPVVVVDISFVLGGSTVVGAPSVDDVHAAAGFPNVFLIQAVVDVLFLLLLGSCCCCHPFCSWCFHCRLHCCWHLCCGSFFKDASRRLSFFYC